LYNGDTMPNVNDIQAQIQALVEQHKQDLVNMIVPLFKVQADAISNQQVIINSQNDTIKNQIYMLDNKNNEIKSHLARIKDLEAQVAKYEPPEPVSQAGEHASPRP